MTLATAHTAARDALRLAQAIATAQEIQWEASPVPKPREDTSQRASGGHGDPTGDIVLDSRRLAVREAVVAAEKALDRAAAELRRARVNVESAVARWNGE
ncbi:hypothetical protein SEA_KAYLISSA_45 [Arthrobacter phage Kaylissa]|uniref:Uncharacterized protein n=1 Tax=Arthrobacter phage Kaylissa TaxID=2835951 RepID=A0AA92N3T5_9CAUD|nr:hypothetical protein PQE14_gp45 [Arthrobacter phage Kaylissa]QXO14579.1 hypothetical protein SEA_KAYLISSA_45 [Arthrobacter phage Kaylissa]